MKTALMAGIVFLMLSTPAFAAESGEVSEEEAKIVEQQKGAAIKLLDERISMLQDERACLSAAKSIADLKVCRQKQREDMITDKFQQRMNRPGVRRRQPPDGQATQPATPDGQPMPPANQDGQAMPPADTQGGTQQQ